MKPDIKQKINASNPKKITELRLDNGRLNTVPQELKDFKRLKLLSLFNNRLKEIPYFVSEFHKLSHLNLSSNNIKIIPTEITNLPNLKTLYFKENSLTDIQGIEMLSDTIEKLDLSSNNLGKLRVDFSSFKKLKNIILDNNAIKAYPKSINKCDKLVKLSLSGNGIKKIPESIESLKKLTYLDLSYNDISELPEEIGSLENLRTLILTGNNIKELPKSFKNLKKLNELSVTGNPIGEVPVEVSSQGLQAVLNYYLHIGASVNLNEAKLLIVGQGAVGKTYLMNKLIRGISKETNTTEGIDIQKWHLLANMHQKETKVRLNAWDFGGQEIYHSTHQFFLTKRSLYLFVWEARTDETLITFDYWLNIIKVLSNSSPVIVVLNKIDERIKEIDEKALKEKFKNIVGFCSVSAKVGTNLDLLKEKIENNVVKLPHIGDKLPKVWSDIREKLESLEDNYISYERYISICNSFGLSKPESKHLSQYFHDLGVFLHFIENTILKPVVFLKPEWATNCVYKILDLKEVIKKNGEFDISLLEDKLNEYTAQQISYVIELMKKFELCFQLRKDIYIIPELLSPSVPDIEWEMDRNISLEYKYDFMPAGIIPRLIVRLKELISDGYYWKNGVYLRYQTDTIGSVLGNIFTRTIKIEVSGESKAFLLEKIKYELDNINSSLNNPYYQLRIKCNCRVCVNSETPYMFNYEYLMKAKRAKIEHVQCQHNIIDVKLSDLIGPYEIKVSKTHESFRYSSKDLTYDIIEIGTRLLERKYTVKLEDIITDNFTDNLRSKGYMIADQTRSGRSKVFAGELDIMVRNPRNMPVAIIEAFKLNSLGMGNTTVIEHLNKLLINYDTNGLPRNYILVYVKNDNFTKIWKSYQKYIKELHMHHLYNPRIKLTSIQVNNDITSLSNIRVLSSEYEVDGRLTEVYHIILNMH